MKFVVGLCVVVALLAWRGNVVQFEREQCVAAAHAAGATVHDATWQCAD